ncbi:MAG TPA: hypothetical protein ENJ95_12505 [Bacteroidetes bacterium]|nr:hypothetical protein [Bacteroidota bacterium]
MKKSIFLFFAFCLFAFQAISQKIDCPPAFRGLLKKANLDFFEPLDAGYKNFEPAENEYLNAQFAIRSAKEKLEIRYFIIPWEEDNPLASNPHISTFTALANVATNADEEVVSVIQPTAAMLQKDFNADWGMTYFFRPKEAFSDKKSCRMVALCKEGQATVFIFYLFNDAGNRALDTRYRALRFLGEAN